MVSPGEGEARTGMRAAISGGEAGNTDVQCVVSAGGGGWGSMEVEETGGRSVCLRVVTILANNASVCPVSGTLRKQRQKDGSSAMCCLGNDGRNRACPCGCKRGAA